MSHISWTLKLSLLCLLLINQSQVLAGTIITGTTIGVKWYPGHYYHVMSGDPSVDSFNMKAAYTEMNTASSSIAGIQLRLSWKQLEPTKDGYDFHIIDGHLAKLISTKKRLFLFIAHKGDALDGGVVPDYIKSIGGSYTYKSSLNSKVITENAKFWEDAVRDRFIKLLNQLGNKYNAHSHFVGVALPETSMGEDSVTDAQESKYFTNLLFINQTMRLAFPNTLTTQFTNFPRSILPNFIGSLRDMGVALGGPDIFIDDPGLNAIGTKYTNDGVYLHYPRLSGKVALTPSVMSGDYERTIANPSDPKNRKPTIDELLDFGRDKLKANIIFWTRAPKFYSAVLKKLRDLTIANNSRVKLNATCPTALITCITD